MKQQPPQETQSAFKQLFSGKSIAALFPESATGYAAAGPARYKPTKTFQSKVSAHEPR